MVKSAWVKILTLVMVAMLLVSTAFATDSVELEIEKMEGFFQDMQGWGIIPQGETPPEGRMNEMGEGVYETSYPMTDFMLAYVTEVIDGPKTYSLFIMHADRPDELDADQLYALFITACSNQAMTMDEAMAIMQELRANSVSEDGTITALKQMDEFVIQLSGSESDSEEALSIIQQPA